MIHWTSVAIALAAGAWLVVHEPGQHLFEQATRAAGLTGVILGPMGLVYTAATAFIAMTLSYAVMILALRLLRNGVSSRLR